MSSTEMNAVEKNAQELWEQLLQECDAMAKHAFSNGLKVPASLIETLENIIKLNTGEVADSNNASLREHMHELAIVHNRLTDIILPAKPRTILLMSNEVEKDGFWLFLGHVPLIRQMMFMAMICLVLLIGLSISTYVSPTTIIQTLLTGHGITLLYVQMVLLAAAGLGASFNSLITANKYVVNGTYDPKYDSSYWVRFVVGIISGVILTQIIEFDTNEHGQGNYSKVAMALIGGFSANLVYRILERLSSTIESLITGGNERKVDDAKREAQLKIDENTSKAKTRLTKQLIQMQQQLNNSNELDKEEIKRLFDQQLNQLMDEDDQPSKVA